MKAVVDCDVAKQDDGTYIVVVTVGPLPQHAVQTVVDALKEPIRAALEPHFVGAGPIIERIVTGKAQ